MATICNQYKTTETQLIHNYSDVQTRQRRHRAQDRASMPLEHT